MPGSELGMRVVRVSLGLNYGWEYSRTRPWGSCRAEANVFPRLEVVRDSLGLNYG